MSKVTIVDHPLVQHKLSIMRKTGTQTAKFRNLLSEIAMLLAYEATRDLPMTTQRIETPLTEMDAPRIHGKKLVLVPVLRAGLGMLDGMLALIPSARVAHLGMFRDPETLEAKEYYFKHPKQMSDRDVLILDPMLATGHTAVAAVARLKATNPRSLKFVALVAAPEGIETLRAAHPDVPIITAAVDSHLNDHAYIVPGLGDAGDRIFGTQ
jgi:uracil phosphoribosyltransferase